MSEQTNKQDQSIDPSAQLLYNHFFPMSSTDEANEINLAEIWNVIWSGRYLIILITAFFTVAMHCWIHIFA